jgi:hypothetical protein
MATEKKPSGEPAEIRAIGTVYNALKDLDPTARARVIRYASEMLEIAVRPAESNRRDLEDSNASRPIEPVSQVSPIQPELDVETDSDGISAVGLKWMRRSGLESKNLQSLFSLGIDDIDLVAEAVPGSNKKDRMRSVLLLKGIAAYLSSGAARITHEHIKEACLHYDAYDSTNFSKYLKSLSSEISGTKEAGYTLSARGLTAGTDLVKEILAPKK